MKTLFYYRIEPMRGSIVNDKQRVNGERFETGYWNEIVGSSLRHKYLSLKESKGIRESVEILKPLINEKIKSFIEGKKLDNPDVKPFYINFNYDGIDCFIHRWNVKRKTLSEKIIEANHE